MSRPALAVLALLTSSAIGCGEGDSSVSWVFRFEDPALADRAAIVHARVLEGGCVPEAEVLWESDVGDGPPAEGAPPLPPGRYGLSGRARDTECRWFASGCENVELPADDGATIAVLLRAEGDEAACPAGTCDAGTCRQDAIVAVAAGRAHSCAVEVSGNVLCWGRNEEGALGNGTTVQSESPVAVRGLDRATDVSVGGNDVGWQSHSCAIRAPNEVWCWGFNQFGQLGDGTVTSRTTPVPVTGVTAPSSISVGDLHTCVVRILDGRALCWGNNAHGQIGDGTNEDRTEPTVVPGVTGVVQVSAGFQHTCARTQAGVVHCWGGNSEGQLGDGTTDDRADPVRVDGTGRVLDVAAGRGHTCVVREYDEPGEAFCWGENGSGQLGDGTTEDRLGPVQVQGLAGARQIGTGATHSCARLDDGTVHCWGANSFGELGDGTTTHRATPAPVLHIDDAVDLSVGNSHACAVRASGEVWCWGRNQFGRLGDGTTVDRLEPVPVTGVGGT